MRLVTITLGPRKWQTTCIAEAICFIYSFAKEGEDDRAEGFKMKSVPYEGKSIDWIVSLN
jgi:hypothetical protein